MFYRRAVRPQGEPESGSSLDRAVSRRLPVVNPGTVNVYRGRRNGMLPDLVATPSIHDEDALARYQRAGFIVWPG